MKLTCHWCPWVVVFVHPKPHWQQLLPGSIGMFFYLFNRYIILFYFYRLFKNPEWGAIQPVGIIPCLLLPDFNSITVEAIVEFMSRGEVVVSSSNIAEFTEITSVLGIGNINEQVCMIIVCRYKFIGSNCRAMIYGQKY